VIFPLVKGWRAVKPDLFECDSVGPDQVVAAELVQFLPCSTVRGREASEAGDPSSSHYCKLQYSFPFAVEDK